MKYHGNLRFRTIVPIAKDDGSPVGGIKEFQAVLKPSVFLTFGNFRLWIKYRRIGQIGLTFLIIYRESSKFSSAKSVYAIMSEDREQPGGKGPFKIVAGEVQINF